MDTVIHFPLGSSRKLSWLDAIFLADKEVPARSWHVDDLIPTGTVTILNGDGGTGKSLISLQLAVATVLGSYWLGRQVRKGPCYFITAEDDIDEIHRRLIDIAKHQQCDIAGMENLAITSLAGEDALMAIPTGKSNLIRPTPLFEEVVRNVADMQPALVVFDTLADMFGGEENSRAQARQFISILRGLAIHHDTTVLLLAHPSLSGMASGSGSSGSTGWSNSVRSRLYLDRIRDAEGREDDPDARIVRGMKSNYSRAGVEIKVRWQAGVFTTVTAANHDSFAGLAADAKAERVFIDLLTLYETDGRPVGAQKGANYAPFVFSGDDRREDVSKVSFTRAMNRLFNDKRIRIMEYGPPSKLRQRLAVVRAQVVDEGD